MNPSSMESKLEEPELLTEVPPILKRLAKTIGYAFYDPELVVLICILTKHSVIDEDTMCEKLQFDKRQLRQALARLKSDKLIKQRTIKEKIPETGNFNVFNFYFINYKVFVNVVKYKLDHIRKKLESEEQQCRNRPSFQCEDCLRNFSDLEVDRLVDPKTGEFVCTFCEGPVVEDASQIQTATSGSSLAKFNEQLEPIFKLLKACENINLAPDILEPVPDTEALKTYQKSQSAGNKAGGWTTDRKTHDLYDQTMQINIGDEILKAKEEKKQKAQPVWMQKSTVFKGEDPSSPATLPSPSTAAVISISDLKRSAADQEIMHDLLAFENSSKKPKLDIQVDFPASNYGVNNIESSLVYRRPDLDQESADSEPDSDSRDSANFPNRQSINMNNGGQSSSSSSRTVTPHHMEMPSLITSLNYTPSPLTKIESTTLLEDDEEFVEEDDDDCGLTVKIGQENVPLAGVTEEMIQKMTPSENDAYLKAYHEAYEDLGY